MKLEKINKDYNNDIKEIDITDEIKNSFLDYAMSVIISRAIPDVRDGLKPVHRRIIYAMWNLDMTYEKQHKKSARIVGEVIGKYHPHGDIAVYESMVRMAQDFSYRYPLIDGHGNFGSLDGDLAAAMRYTEARMSKIAGELIRDIDKETVPFVNNYDSSEYEPLCLPSYLPNLLINGASGIAVGMATNIPPHNLVEIIDGIIAITKNNKITTFELMKIIKGPDFPTGALVTAGNELLKAYETGNGTIKVRSKVDFFEKNNDKKLIISEIPYQVNKAKLVKKIAELVKEKVISGINDIRDESNHNRVRIVIDLKKNAQKNFVLNKLYKLTSLQINFSLNILALHNNQPKVMGLKEILIHFIDHQVKIIVKRSLFELNKIKFRLLILEGLKIALDNLDEIIEVIKNSQTTKFAINSLISKFNLNLEQAKAILDMRLQRLTILEIKKIELEINEIKLKITELNYIICNYDKQLEIMISELENIKFKYGDSRRSKIISEKLTEINPEKLIRIQNLLIMLSSNGYIKCVLPDEFKLQNRGGKGISCSNNSNDFLISVINANSINLLLFISNKGKVYKLYVYQIDIYSKYARGIPLINLISISKNEKIKSVLSINSNKKDYYLFFATKKGKVKKTNVSEFLKVRKSGKIAIKLKKDDEIVQVILTDGNSEIFLFNDFGKVVRFKESEIKNMNRNSIGIKGINNNKNVFVLGLCSRKKEKYVISITENGFAKKTLVEKYKLSCHGSKGIISMKIINKDNDKLKFIRVVNGNENILISTRNNNIIKLSLSQIPLVNRIASGVKLIKLNKSDVLESVEILNE